MTDVNLILCFTYGLKPQNINTQKQIYNIPMCEIQSFEIVLSRLPEPQMSNVAVFQEMEITLYFLMIKYFVLKHFWILLIGYILSKTRDDHKWFMAKKLNDKTWRYEVSDGHQQHNYVYGAESNLQKHFLSPACYYYLKQ